MNESEAVFQSLTDNHFRLGAIMKKQLVKHELRLMGVAIFSAFLLVFAHLILAKSFSHMVWTEYTAAVIPFVMFGLCVVGVKYAARADKDEDESNS
ncbi:hypothetical protein CGH90_12635 [Vibrio parahaemolyticus]|uniref:Uncharacterized protein n=7 Tax=Vibrio TaxID=662 RepID=A0AA46L304_VIBPH|nr:hypothetical protein [Vibrio parahaemolyticus]QHH14538.1 hypothetical protein EHC68_06435 [Vibrio parahaemolyticus]TOG95917.1 hypothetical protein CGI92_11775 [Vibrio parahaemolyticus]TOI27722.1 hypothetical protein CGI64_11650 [Vibrio parahaemolyticus]TOL81378.1 hypothetical protein CGH90_12635 [Vibrio parahaemolyticus]